MPKSQVASRAAQDAPITINQGQLRQARLEQKYRQISQSDNASTTGLLVNPPAAVIPNPTGAGGQAGGQGQFGSGNPTLSPSVMGAVAGSSFNIRTGITNQRVTLPNGQVVSVPANSAVRSPTIGGDYMTPTGVGNRSGFAPAGTTAVGFTNLAGKGGNVNPVLSRNVFAGVQAGAGYGNVLTNISQPSYDTNQKYNITGGMTQANTITSGPFAGAVIGGRSLTDRQVARRPDPNFQNAVQNNRSTGSSGGVPRPDNFLFGSYREKGGNVNPMLARNVFAGVQTGAGAVAGANVPNFIPSGVNLPQVPVNLAFGQVQPSPRAIINQPGFNGANAPIMPPVSGQPNIYPQQPQATMQPQGFQTPTTNGFTSTSNGTPRANNQRTSGQNINDGSFTPTGANTGTAGYWAGYNQQQSQQPAGSQRPNVPYSEATAQQWKDYWNWSAANPEAVKAQITADAIAKGQPDPFAPVVMTREQIWEMKAAQRRRQMAKSDVQPATYGYNDLVQTPVPYTGSGTTGNYYSTILNTGSG